MLNFFLKNHIIKNEFKYKFVIWFWRETSISVGGLCENVLKFSATERTAVWYLTRTVLSSNICLFRSWFRFTLLSNIDFGASFSSS